MVTSTGTVSLTRPAAASRSSSPLWIRVLVHGFGSAIQRSSTTWRMTSGSRARAARSAAHITADWLWAESLVATAMGLDVFIAGLPEASRR